MSQAPPPPSDSDELRFDIAEPGDAAESPGAARCSGCGNALEDTYYVAGDQIVCPNCRNASAASPGGSRMGRLFRATVFGLIAGLVGAAIWFGVRRLTGYEVGLIAIVVGLLVGGAVKAGSRGRGGVGYQILAVLLTYFSICANYMPDIFLALRDEYRQEQPELSDAPQTQPVTATTAPAATTPASGAQSMQDDGKPSGGEMALGLIVLVVFMFVLALMAPFLGGASNIIGILIIAFALWEAWKINKRHEVNLAGPYTLGPDGGTGAGAVANPGGS